MNTKSVHDRTDHQDLGAGRTGCADRRDGVSRAQHRRDDGVSLAQSVWRHGPRRGLASEGVGEGERLSQATAGRAHARRSVGEQAQLGFGPDHWAGA